MRSEIESLQGQIRSLRASLEHEIKLKAVTAPNPSKNIKKSQSVAVGTDDMDVDEPAHSQLNNLEVVLSHVQTLYDSHIHQTAQNTQLIAAEVDSLLSMYHETERENQKLKDDVQQLQREKESWLEREAELKRRIIALEAP
jgi:hypothetical protein